MKVKMYKKIVSLVSAFSLAVTGLTGLSSFSASAAAPTPVLPDYTVVDADHCNCNNDHIHAYDISSYKKEITKTASTNAWSKSSDQTVKVDLDIDSKTITVDNSVTVELFYDVTSISESKIKWVVESLTPGSASTAAGFKNKKQKGERNLYDVTKQLTSKEITAGKADNLTSFTLGNLKASGQFTNAVIVKLVSDDYKVTKKTVKDEGNNKDTHYSKQGEEYGGFMLYIKPAAATRVECTTKKDYNNKKGTTFSIPTGSDPGELVLPEGSSYKLSYAAVGAADKSLVWKSNDSTLFSVVNGTVKALKAGSSSIEVWSPTNPSAKATIDVTVTSPDFAPIRADKSTITLVPNAKNQTYGDVQYITVNPKDFTADCKNGYYLVTVVKGAVDGSNPKAEIKEGSASNIEIFKEDGSKATKFGKTNVKTGDVTYKLPAPAANDKSGIVKFGVAVNNNLKKLPSGAKITVTACNNKYEYDTKKLKPVSIGLKLATAPDDPKSIKETAGKVNKAENIREINVVQGQTFNLGVSVNPVTANSAYTIGTYSDYACSSANTAKVEWSGKGDIIKAKAPGVAYVMATAIAKDVNGNDVNSSVYKVTVYKPASSFSFNDTRDHTNLDGNNVVASDSNKEMTVQGGYLMEKKDADKGTTKEIEVGKVYNFTEPNYNGGVENVVWTVNKAGASVIVDKLLKDNGDVERVMSVSVYVPGTYTITGTTQFTKQKYSFKVMATALSANLGSATGLKFYDAVTGEEVIAPINKSRKVMAMLDGGSDELYKKVKYSVEGKASVTGAGVVTAKAAGQVEVSLTPTNSDGEEGTAITGTITFNELPPVYTASANVYSIDGTKTNTVKLTSKGVKNPTWYMVEPGGSLKLLDSTSVEIAAYADPENASAFAAADPKQDYEFYFQDADGIQSNRIKVTAYKGFLTKVPAIDNPVTAYSDTDYESTVDIKKVQKAWSEKNSDNGVALGDKIRIPVVVNAKETEIADLDEIVWTVSNTNLASIAKVADDDMAKKTEDDSVKFSLEYEITVSESYTGKVTLTGITPNGNRKITLTLYIH